MATTITRTLAIPGLTSHISTSEDRVALIDSEGKIVGVNDKWLTLAEEAGVEIDRIGPGTNYLDVCRRANSSCASANEALNGIHAVLRGRLESLTMDYSAEVSSEIRHFRMSVTP